MRSQSEAQLVDLVINWIKKNKLRDRPLAVQINGDTDMIEAGLVDSLGLVELLVFLESQSGCQIDLTDADPSEFCVVKGLCRIALGT